MRVSRMLATLCCVAMFAATAQAAHLGLVISGVFDGPLTGGVPKVVELYANADIPDLSRWAIGSANNAGGSDGPETVLSGSAASGDFIYVVQDSTAFNDYFGFTPSILIDGSFANGGAAAVNGDDAIEVFFDADNDAGGDIGTGTGFEVVGDTFGEIAGSFDSYQDGWAYRNTGTTPTDPGGVYTASDWTFSGADVNDGKMTNVDPDAFPIGTYNPIPEPATVALLALGFAGLATLRRQTK